MYAPLSLSLAILLLVLMLDKMGQGIVLREIVAFLYTLTCLVLPVVGYTWYTDTNFLARLWMKYMPVSESTYFSFALPAIALFCLAITLPFSKNRDNEQGEGIKLLLQRMRIILPAYRKVGLILLSGGTGVLFLLRFLPAGLQYVGYLFFFSSFAGLLYLYFAGDFKNKKWIMGAFIAFIAYNAISGGMFTIVAYMGINVASFMLIGRASNFLKKLGIFVLAAIFFIILQNVKVSYRNEIWANKEYEGSKLGLFSNLFWENLQKGDELITNTDAFFPVYTRANQGYVVAMVMLKIPKEKPYDGGSLLTLNFASAFVPRFLWPDKPEAGGKFNMKYYTGYDIEGFSMNVGPLGEAYGSFGPQLGVVYMFFLGLFIRWVYRLVFKIVEKLPLLVCWIPVMFYQVISSSETDSLTAFNSIVKSAVFVWLLYKIFPNWFGIQRVSRFKVRRSAVA